MTSVFQLYGRPLEDNEPLPPLMITGELEGYTSGEAYEGRLQIIDSIGKCVVEIVESDLPPGAYAFVDNFTKEIVLRWPAYSPPELLSSGVHNGDFELGDDGSWRFGAGWSIEAGGAETGTYSGVFQNQRGDSSIESARVPYVPGTVINASCRFQQGASSSGNLVGRIMLMWCDENGNSIPGGEGSTWAGGNVIRSGSGGEWKTSSVTGSSQTAKTVSIGFSAGRKKQNHLARVDNFQWDHTYNTGTNSDLDFTVTFKVTDSENRVAYWTGIIAVFIPEYPEYPKFLLSGNSTSFSYSNDAGTAFQPAFVPTNWFGADYPVYNLNGRIFGVTSTSCRYSDDGGLTFTLTTIPAVANARGTVTVTSVLVPAASSGVRRSLDAVTWTTHGAGKNFSGCMAAGGGLVAALGEPNVPHVSTNDGVTWVSGKRLDTSPAAFNTGSNLAGSYFAGAIYFGGEIWGGPFGVSSFIPAFARTTGGNIFTYEVVEAAGGLGSVSHVVINTISVCVTTAGRVYYRPEGGSWTYSGLTLDGAVDILSYNDNVFLLGGGAPGSKKLYTSAQGAIWSEITNPFTTSLGSLVLI